MRGRVGTRTWRVEVPQHMATQSVPLASLAALGSSRLAFMSHSTPNWRLQMASTSPCTVARSQSSCRQSSRRRASPARTNAGLSDGLPAQMHIVGVNPLHKCRVWIPVALHNCKTSHARTNAGLT